MAWIQPKLDWTVVDGVAFGDLNRIEGNINEVYGLVNGKAPVVHEHDASAINTGVLPIIQGGTGGSTAAVARNNMGLGNTNGPLPIANGGTGQATAAAARNALGLGNTTGAVPIANGGTGATSVANAIAALGLDDVVGALFKRTTTQSIPKTTATAIQWNSYVYNPNSAHNTTYLSRMYAKKAGVYTIQAFATLNKLEGTSDLLSPGAYFTLDIRKNGTTLGGLMKAQNLMVEDSDIITVPLLATLDCIELALNDYIEVFVYHNNSVSVVLESGTTARPSLSMRRVHF